jgi:hypothetical protein
MPNHIHMIIAITKETGDRGRSPLQQIVCNLKSYVTMMAVSLIGKNLFTTILYEKNVKIIVDFQPPLSLMLHFIIQTEAGLLEMDCVKRTPIRWKTI